MHTYDRRRQIRIFDRVVAEAESVKARQNILQFKDFWAPYRHPRVMLML